MLLRTILLGVFEKVYKTSVQSALGRTNTAFIYRYEATIHRTALGFDKSQMIDFKNL